MNDNVFLYGLADELGMEAGLLRLTLLASANAHRTAPSVNTPLKFADKASPSTALKTVTVPAASGGTPGSIEVVVHSDTYDLVPQAGGVCGFMLTFNPGADATNNAEDSGGFLHGTLTGVLPDDEEIPFILGPNGIQSVDGGGIGGGGDNVLELPGVIVTDGSVVVKFENDAAVAGQVGLAAKGLRVKSAAALMGARRLATQGKQVGSAKAALQGTIAAACAETAAAQTRALPAILQAHGFRPSARPASVVGQLADSVRSGVPNRLGRVFGGVQGMLENAEEGWQVLQTAADKGRQAAQTTADRVRALFS